MNWAPWQSDRLRGTRRTGGIGDAGDVVRPGLRHLGSGGLDIGFERFYRDDACSFGPC